MNSISAPINSEYFGMSALLCLKSTKHLKRFDKLRKRQQSVHSSNLLMFHKVYISVSHETIYKRFVLEQ